MTDLEKEEVFVDVVADHVVVNFRRNSETAETAMESQFNQWILTDVPVTGEEIMETVYSGFRRSIRSTLHCYVKEKNRINQTIREKEKKKNK